MHFSIKLFSLAIVLLAGTVACNSLFKNNDNNAPELTIQASQATSQTTTFNGDTLVFKPVQKEDELYEYPPFTSTTKNQQIVINGYYLAASGFQPAGTFEEENKTITIQIQRAAFDTDAPEEPKGYFYDAYISNLEKEEYTIKIIHKGDFMRGHDGETHTVFTKDFVIE